MKGSGHFRDRTCLAIGSRIFGMATTGSDSIVVRLSDRRGYLIQWVRPHRRREPVITAENAPDIFMAVSLPDGTAQRQPDACTYLFW